MDELVVVGHACLELVFCDLYSCIEVVMRMVNDLRLFDVQKGRIEDWMHDERTVIELDGCPSFEVNVVQ